MSPVPFSMPKLERKLAERSRPTVSLSMTSKAARPLSLHSSTPARTTAMRLPLQTSGNNDNEAKSIELNCIQMIFFFKKFFDAILFTLEDAGCNKNTIAESDTNLLSPAEQQLAVRRKPFLFLPPASIELSRSKSVDTSIPLESQE